MKALAKASRVDTALQVIQYLNDCLTKIGASWVFTCFLLPKELSEPNRVTCMDRVGYSFDDTPMFTIGLFTLLL